MFIKSEAAAFLRKLQRPLITILALALMVNVWSLRPASECGPEASCASSSRATFNLDDHPAAVVGALESVEKAESDLDNFEDTLFDFVLVLPPDRSWSIRVADAVGVPDGNSHHIFPEKTGPPIC